MGYIDLKPILYCRKLFPSRNDEACKLVDQKKQFHRFYLIFTKNLAVLITNVYTVGEIILKTLDIFSKINNVLILDHELNLYL